jgi:hypothetical protein
MNDVVVLDQRFEFGSGLNYLHLVQVGQPVDVAAVVDEYVPGQCRDWFLDVDSEEGKLIKRHHLELWYPYRDVIRVRPLVWDGDESRLINGVFWRRTGQERMSAIIQDAADLYWGHFDAAPSMAIVQQLPKNAPERMELQGACEGVSIPILAREWMPRASVIVCGPILPELL